MRDTTAPGLALSAPVISLARGALALSATSSEACTLVARGTLSVPGASRVYRLRSVERRLSGPGRVRLSLRIPRRARVAARRALARGQRVTATVTVRAVDSVGNARATRRRVRLGSM